MRSGSQAGDGSGGCRDRQWESGLSMPDSGALDTRRDDLCLLAASPGTVRPAPGVQPSRHKHQLADAQPSTSLAQFLAIPDGCVPVRKLLHRAIELTPSMRGERETHERNFVLRIAQLRGASDIANELDVVHGWFPGGIQRTLTGLHSARTHRSPPN